ncbi:unnamed protein product [Pleuronectes platessa]|uniref:Uncharacterized protein n=1 Tax=Pleuronectes platessa TaxID=8262 RepID=A0A9N7TQB6_PLEPL|nr:unnamed protein product [Pleuronectes platessa]
MSNSTGESMFLPTSQCSQCQAEHRLQLVKFSASSFADTVSKVAEVFADVMTQGEMEDCVIAIADAPLPSSGDGRDCTWGHRVQDNHQNSVSDRPDRKKKTVWLCPQMFSKMEPWWGNEDTCEGALEVSTLSSFTWFHLEEGAPRSALCLQGVSRKNQAGPAGCYLQPAKGALSTLSINVGAGHMTLESMPGLEGRRVGMCRPQAELHRPRHEESK